MSAAEILGRIVQREAEKLDKKSAEKAEEALAEKELEVLESLARTVKLLRSEKIGRPSKDEEFDDADLKLLEGS